MNHHEILTYNEHKFANGNFCISLHKVDNDISDISVDDTVSIDSGIYEVIKIEPFMKSFDAASENLLLLLEPAAYKNVNIEHLSEELVSFINVWLPDLDWEGSDSCATVKLQLGDNECIKSDLMNGIAAAVEATHDREFELTIRPSENLLLLYYID